MGTAFQVDIAIRPEQEVDRDQIHDLTKRAFAPMAFASGDEQDLITALRDADALTISLVAVQDGEVVGHIVFSPANSADGAPGWFALGPVSVAPEVQGLGIGRLLIEAGLQRLIALDAAGCILTGNPAYYRRFGFVVRVDLAPPGEPSESYMVRSLGDPTPSQVVSFHPLFHAAGT